MWRQLNRSVMLIKKGNIEVSIGKAVGHVFEDLLISAKRRLWVVSPWISPEYADLILKKKAEGVDVQVKGFETKVIYVKDGKILSE